MTIGKTIKKLRRERDMTQEQLAELLGITANAVSQWECDRTAPDISQLPVLANIFRVSADVILGIDVSAKDARVEAIYREVRELWCTARRDEAEALCRKGLQEFPDAYCLMEELAWNLSYSQNQEELEESIVLFERLRSSAADENTRNFALGTLCELYMKTGKRDEAKRIAESVPVQTYTRADCIKMTLRGTELAVYTRDQIVGNFDKLIWALTNFLRSFDAKHPLFDAAELLALWGKVIALTEAFYEDGDPGFHEHCVILAHHARARLYLGLGETDHALHALEQMQLHIAHFDAYADGLLGDHVVLPREKWPTSLLVRPLGEDDAAVEMTVSADTDEPVAAYYLRELRDPVFDPIRTHDRFLALEEKLKQG